jgi:hypothetical protein
LEFSLLINLEITDSQIVDKFISSEHADRYFDVDYDGVMLEILSGKDKPKNREV